MSKLFMYGTSLEGIEQLMVMVPNLFLLTADEKLWQISENHMLNSKFDLIEICLRDIDTNGYALYQTAKTLSTGKECIRINELADKDLIDDYIFKAIINSALSIDMVQGYF